MRMVFVVLSVLFVGVAHAGTITCTTYGNTTTCTEQPTCHFTYGGKYVCD